MSSAGVAMDDLVYICTKIARQMDANGLDKIFDTAEAAMGAIEEARPLLQRAVELVNEVVFSCLSKIPSDCGGQLHQIAKKSELTIQ